MQHDGKNMRQYMNMLNGEQKQPINERKQLNESVNLVKILDLVGQAVHQAPESAKAPLADALTEYMSTYKRSVNTMNPYMKELFRQLLEATDTTPDMEDIYW
jgi:hypothetical protein